MKKGYSMSDQLMKVLTEYEAYKLGCERAIALLEDPDANEFQAEKVISYLNAILKGKTS
jgi:hypothetical protein